ncbi:MAG: GGDEF domain-containing protein [Myxococcales bacterium]|nr:GGDEF domain-containing protein [Myxococcales bacterium]
MDAAAALHVLLELTRRLTDERSLPAALRLVTDAALRLLPGDHASIRVLDHTCTELLCGARSGTGRDNKPQSFRLGEGVAGWVVDHRELVRIDEVTRDARFVALPAQGFQIASMLAVPLWSAGEVIGVLAASHPDPDRFSADDEALASLLANCAVPPIEKARLARLAITDPHTMAFNQAFLMPGLQGEMDRTRGASEESPGPLSMLLMDLDQFKRVNDSYGHAAGDAVLRAFADRVRQATREHDKLVRRGGDEFVLIMPGAPPERAAAVGERIRERIAREPFDLGGGVLGSVTVSVGVATWDGRESPEDFEKRADAAMYEAKLHGRNRVSAAPAADAPASAPK